MADLVAWAASSPVELVVITGGEPLIQQRNLTALAQGLLAAGKRVEFETNGTIAPDPALLIDGVRFNVSPKVQSFGVDESTSIVPSALEAFAATGSAVFKFVASSVPDLDRIAELAAAHRLAPVWVMPEGTTAEAIIAATRVLAERGRGPALALHYPAARAGVRRRPRPLTSPPLPLFIPQSPEARETSMTRTSTVSPTAAASSAVPAPAMPALRIDTGRVSDLIAQLLVALGEDPAREGLTGTPERVASWWNTSCPQTAPGPRRASPSHT